MLRCGQAIALVAERRESNYLNTERQVVVGDLEGLPQVPNNNGRSALHNAATLCGGRFFSPISSNS